MALTYGFFNSINHDRVYDAIQFGQIFDGIITDGVYGTYLKGMIVIASENANEVIIQPGRAWFNHTWSYNDANLPFEAPEPEVLLDRIDTLVLDINLEQAERRNQYLWVQGTPASKNPQRPTLIRSTTHNQYPLCDVYRKAGTTSIYTKDITNRIGTSDTPFVTGVLEGIDLDAWINQWDNEFHTWENSTKSEFNTWETNTKNEFDTWESTVKDSFEAWMLTQQTVYMTWFNTLKDQMDTDLADFEAWFDTIKDIIDQSAATHLQAEIDELKNQLPAGSHITVVTTNSELFDRNVIITDGSHPATTKFDNNGVAVLDSYPYVGAIEISSTDGIQTASKTVEIPYFGRYAYEIWFWAATVNIIADDRLAGYEVIIRDSNNNVVGTVTLDSNSEGTWIAKEPDTYKFSVTYGGRTMEVSLNVTQETTYTVELYAGFDYNRWLEEGDVSGTYADLDAVLADEVAVRKLMTKHASVDYLASFNENDEGVITVLSNDLVAKWTSLRDYAMDKLEEAYSTLLPTIGDWAYIGKVPKMTSNTTPYGVASANSASDSHPAWHAFRNDPTSTDGYSSGTNNAGWIQYEFPSAVIVTQLAMKAVYLTQARMGNFRVKGSNDGSTWSNALYSDTWSGTDVKTFTFTNSTAYKYYRVEWDAFTAYTCIAYLQFYSYEFQGSKYGYGEWALMPQVPKMTSNNTPYGEAFANDVYSGSSGFEAYCAFDNSDSTLWAVNTVASSSVTTITDKYIQYHFEKPVCAKQIKVKFQSVYIASMTYKIMASNDKFAGDSHDLATNLTTLEGNVTLNNDDYYYDYRLYINSQIASQEAISGRAVLGRLIELQFYAWQPKGNVPVMTSNDAPYGAARASSEFSTSRQAWLAFSQFNGSNTWASTTATSPFVGYLSYYFTNPVCVKKIKYMQTFPGGAQYLIDATYKIQYYIDGDATWTDVNNETYSFLASKSLGDESFDNAVYARSWRIVYNSPNVKNGANYSCQMAMLQFYGRELKVSVPAMTSNTTPYGEASALTEDTYPAWKAFDGDDSTYYRAQASQANNRLQYKFTSPVVVNAFRYRNGSPVTNAEIVGSNDGQIWTPVKTVGSVGDGVTIYDDVENSTPYLYYGFKCDTATRFGCYTLQFFGKDYSEYDWDTEHPRHYIYDHGVELEEIDAPTDAGSKETYYLNIAVGSSTSNNYYGLTALTNIVDLTDYDLMRAVMGMALVGSVQLQASTQKTSYSSGRIAYKSFSASDGNIPNNLHLDISAITQNAYPNIVVGAVNNNVNITEWWLE